MELNIDNLKLFVEKIKNIGFIERLFSWSKVKTKLIDAVSDLQKIIHAIDSAKTENAKLENALLSLQKDLEIVKQAKYKSDSELDKLNLLLNEKNQSLAQFNSELSTEREKRKNFEDLTIKQSGDLVNLRENNFNYSKQVEVLKEDIASKSAIIENNNLRKAESSNIINNLNEKIALNASIIEKLNTDIATYIENNKNIQNSNNELYNELTTLKEKFNNTKQSLDKSNQDLATNIENNKNLQVTNSKLSTDLASLKEKLLNIEQLYAKITEQNTQLLKDEEYRKSDYEMSVSALNKIQEQLQNDRNKEVEERNIVEIERLKNLKETWAKHQDNVKNAIKNVAAKHAIDYIEKVPFRGTPDNTLKICEEFVVFDAKSPASDDLSNFPKYLKEQAEQAKKYAKQESVKTDIFFVVPTNTLEKINTYVHNLGDFNVFIVAIDSLEQIILTLKKIEDYEFAEQLSPEDRENICRIIGKFAHLTKRRIQVDSFFAKKFIELAYKSETDLPTDVLNKVKEFEKSEKINPPIEQRVKSINTKELEIDANKLNSEAKSKGIAIDENKISNLFDNLELYSPDNA